MLPVGAFNAALMRAAFVSIFACSVVLAFPANAAASWLEEQAAQCTAAIAIAEQKYQLPAGLLGTIARVESGRPIAGLNDIHAWPWTIDADGRGLFLDSKPAALAWAKQGSAQGVHSMDVGCMQVNLQAHPNAFKSLDEAFDPMINADYAARYLRSLQSEAGGVWNVAVGLYHSHTPDLAADYRNRVADVGRGILTGIGGPEPLYQRAMRQATLRLTLAGGGMLVLNLRRQPSKHPQHRSPCQVAAIIAPELSRPPRMAGCRL